MRDLEGKTAVVTGSASGMGFAFAECFGREGMNVVMCDIEEKALRAAAAQLESAGASVLPVIADVSDEASMDHLGEASREAFGGVHVVCLNAGISPPTGPMETLTANDWRWTLGVNLWGVIHGIRVFLPTLQDQDEGHIVVTASVAGLTSYPWLGAYNASKHAVTTIAETLYAELLENGSKVRISCLCPGAVATNIGDAERNRPKELRNAAASRVEQSDLASFSEIFEAIAAKPAAVAELVLAAVVEERFWIETDELYRDPIRTRHRSIEAQTEPPARGLILAPYLDR
ncbi:MAG: SDR family NAD(P)-dependent oxidoreductase [Myxococcota bacterium]|jgi:NAD(P)-dependent dehydrogenase (short-subunit alcohol dehydrogenase family)|nr:SDR family NAD(P)-dependent oxidoreductase [bacterium]MDP6073548.1 SDR family NAD(P)-dependent oxidoreductase [Myxococcota bacterium]MDP7073215.1 SDR family NAD(P)-dependent oxidoreductase [Myxococcota bacterium]MDP7301390.1 SDR family NAD(P)-dependent oxidoreductase [Myxococcota bacterium]MDP7434223.1 SDR family NAD(P)-dependent oxidoreductase [Myxococcota bacterium]